jgi:hypothetical protein
MVVAIAGCITLALCIAAVLLPPVDAQHRRLRPLANAARLTRLPEYVRAKRTHTRTAVATIVLLVVMFAGAIVAAARPTGMPTSATQSSSAEPEDIMLCVGAPVTDPTAGAVLRYFADQVDHFGTQRIGLTSRNRRVVPLTRDYQYVKATFSDYARPADQGDGLPAFAPPTSYQDYAESVEDLLALCVTGFPDFNQKAMQRRSLIFIGPGQLRTAGDPRPALFTTDHVRDLALAAGVQVNILITGPDSAALDSLARDTAGQSFSADSSAAAHLAEIRDKPPAARFSDADGALRRSTESPDVPLLIALLAAAALAGWPLVQRP